MNTFRPKLADVADEILAYLEPGRQTDYSEVLGVAEHVAADYDYKPGAATQALHLLVYAGQIVIQCEGTSLKSAVTVTRVARQTGKLQVALVWDEIDQMVRKGIAEI